MSRLKTPKNLSVSDLLNQLRKHKLLHNENALSSDVLDKSKKPVMNIVNRIWSISGAFTVANLIIWTMAITGIVQIDNPYNLYLIGEPSVLFEFLLGSILVLNGLRLHSLNRNSKISFLSGFSLQESISSIILGYYLLILTGINFTTLYQDSRFFLFGFNVDVNLFGLNPLALYFMNLGIISLFVSVLMFFYFKRPSLQATLYFLTSIFFGLCVAIQQPLDTGIVRNKYILIYYTLLSIACIYLLLSRQTKHYYNPLSGALVTSLTLFSIILFSIPISVGNTPQFNQFYSNGFFAIYELPYIIFGLILIVMLKIAGGLRQLFTWPHMIICLASFMMSITPLDGLNISILLILLGTHTGIMYYECLVLYFLHLM